MQTSLKHALRNAYGLKLSESDARLLIDGVAELLEAGQQPQTASDLRRLVRLHRRLYAFCGFHGRPEYAFRRGCVVSAATPITVIAQPHDWASHGEPARQSVGESRGCHADQA